MTPAYRRLLSSIGFLAAVLAPSAALASTQSFCTFQTPLTTWDLNGDAFVALNSEIRLSVASITNQVSSAYVATPYSLTATSPFHAHFTFQTGASATGGDGLAFILQSTTGAGNGPNALGTGTTGGMGYGGVTPSVVVEFDTYKNTGDPNANNVAILLNGSTTAHAVTGTPAFTMAGGGVLNAWVDYDPTGHTISVFLAQTATKPATPVINAFGLNLFTQLGSPTQMYVGFGSSTGAAVAETNETDVLSLEASTSGTPCACEGDSVCSGATPACATSGICATCSATNHTQCTGTTPYCDVPLAACEACLTNANCANPKPICDSTALACRACQGNADCGGATPRCATTGANVGDCVLCVADGDCSGTTPRCSATNACVQCLTGADCGGNKPVCAAGVCRACATDADCGGTTPACEVWGACGQCSPTNASACTGGTNVCDNPTGTCVHCEFNSDCSGTTPTCNTSLHTCQACQTNSDCAGNPGGSACLTSGLKAGSCVICQQDSDCASSAAPKCDTVANECVSCLTSADCSGSTPVCGSSKICVGCGSSADCPASNPVCDPTSSVCKPCSNDYAATNPGVLACPTALLGACQPAGSPLAGQCAVCSAVNASACVTVAATPVCIAASATCGCAKDSDCAADSYCDTTTTSTGSCAAGCRVVTGVDNCATGKYCSKTDGSVGTCTSQVCNANADCTAPLAVCDTIVQPHVCVACLNNPDCSGGDVCDTTNKCVECTKTKPQNCKATGKGSACLASESCGCATDADCGGATSGRVCDATSHTCATGCRGTGGNGCPAPDSCSSKDSSVGQCKGPAGVDAGQPAADAGVDASVAVDGAPTGHIVSESVGCSCRTAAPRGEERTGAVGGLLLGLALAVRRRRAR